MHRLRGNDYAAVLPPALYRPGCMSMLVSAKSGERATTFPGGEPQQPGVWPFHADHVWSFRVTPSGTPMRLLNPEQDYSRLSFVRPGEQYRTPFFQIVPAQTTTSPRSACCCRIWARTRRRATPRRFHRRRDRGADRGCAAGKRAGSEIAGRRRHAKSIEVLLIERDGTAWGTSVVAGKSWSTVHVPLENLHVARSIHIPSPFPGLWDYWRETPAGRGGSGDRIHAEDVERLQLTVFANSGRPRRRRRQGCGGRVDHADLRKRLKATHEQRSYAPRLRHQCDRRRSRRHAGSGRRWIRSRRCRASRAAACTSFDAGWKFSRGDFADAVDRGFDDQAWQTVDLPHDWSIAGPYEDAPAATTAATCPPASAGIASASALPGCYADRHLVFEFDGVYQRQRSVDQRPVSGQAPVWLHRFLLRSYAAPSLRRAAT